MISGELEVVKVLIVNDANVNAATEYGNTPLHYSNSEGIRFLYKFNHFLPIRNYNFIFKLISQK